MIVPVCPVFVTVCAAELCSMAIVVATVPVCMISTFPSVISLFLIATVDLDRSAGLKLYLVSVLGVDIIVPVCPVYVVPEGVVYVNVTTVCGVEFFSVVRVVATVPVFRISTFPPEISLFVIATVGLDESAGLKLYWVSVLGVDMIVPACPVYVVPEGVVYVNVTTG